MPAITSGLKQLLEDNVLGLATLAPDGTPHVIAVACCQVVGNRVIISNSHIQDTVVNLQHNPAATIVVWYRDWETICVGFELKGKAKNFTKGPWLDLVKNLPDNAGYDIRSAIVFTVSKIKQLLS
jgi:hypothetical protein